MARNKITLNPVEFDSPVVKALVDLVNGLVDEIDTLYAKLNADAGVTDTNYGASAATKKIE